MWFSGWFFLDYKLHDFEKWELSKVLHRPSIYVDKINPNILNLKVLSYLLNIYGKNDDITNIFSKMSHMSQRKLWLKVY